MVTLLLLTATSACTGATEPDAPDLALDPGNYPTSPRDIDATRTPATGTLQESIRLAEHVPLLMDINSKLVFGRGYNTAHLTAQHPPLASGGVSYLENFNERLPGLIAGWRTGAARRAATALGLDVTLAVLRFTTGEQAIQAMNKLADAANAKYPPKGPLDLPGHETERTYHTMYDAVQSYTVHDEYLLWTYVSDGLATPPDTAPLLDTARAVIDRQIAMLAEYRPTPPDRLDTLPADTDGMLARTLPYGANSYDDPTGVYPARVFLHMVKRPDLMARAFTDAGVDVVARGSTVLFRAADADAAERLAGALVTHQSDDMDPAEPPTGGPPATCLTERPVSSQDPGGVTQCYLVRGRYVALVGSTQPQDLTQRLAAQYLLMADL
ncbi:Uncharacterised protein [Nocardia farcinica]|uniref:Uncharacterized protein n=1 Tax=Nocardia farcinica TaxID=37329 RepID=A0A0H5NU32_NOCFR|nr:hypothetical protein DXT66_12715 [Nocardia farcinica]CRY78992.1 Uncharacterised protein [Nocardia farcinica]